MLGPPSPKRPTLSDRIYGAPPDAVEIARAWTSNLVDQLIDLVWTASDRLRNGDFARVDDWEDLYDLERDITEHMADAVQAELHARGGLLPVTFSHAPRERSSRLSDVGQPKEYDLGFKHNSDKRMVWPVEAKVIRGDEDTSKNLGDYVETLNTRFLTCAYAPYSPSGAMLGYLKAGDPEVVAECVARRLGAVFGPYEPQRESGLHRVSDHKRSVPGGKPYPVDFQCHHLLMSLRHSD